MTVRELLRVALSAESLDDEVVFENDNATYIEQFDVKAEYNAETNVLIFKEDK